MNLLPGWWKAHFLRAELILCVFLTIFLALWAEFFGGVNSIEQTLRGNRSAMYGTLASIFGSLLGFVITAVSIVLGYSANDRLAVVRDSEHYPLLWKTFTSAIRCLGVATLTALMGLMLDREVSSNRWVFYLCVLTTLLAVARLARCVWVLDNVVKLVTSAPRGRPRDDA